MKTKILLAVFATLILLPVSGAQNGTIEFESQIDQAKQNMMAAPETALSATERALELAQTTGSASDVLTASWLQGEALNRMNRPNEAIAVLENALTIANAKSIEGRLLADLQKARADSASAVGNYADGLSYYEDAYEQYSSLGEQRQLAITLLNIANIYADARNYKKALSYYEQAREAYDEDPQIELALLNNIATAYRETAQFQSAAKGLEEALEIAKKMDSPMLQVRILSNLAAVQMDDQQFETAGTTLEKAINMNREHPSAWEPFLFALEARLAFAQERYSYAARKMNEAFEGTDLNTTPIAFVEFHEAAYEIYNKAGQPRAALAHLHAFKRLDDEMRDISASANTSLIGAQFDFASQELRIERLRSETLEQEIRLNKARAQQRMVIMLGSAGIMLIILIGGTVHYFSMRKSRNQVRRANEELETTNVALEEALHAKSEFLATTSHEIRTPLNAILGMSELLAAQKELDENARERAELVHTSGLAMKAIVDDILDMAKFESGTVSVDLATTNIVSVLQAATDVWSAEANKKKLKLVSDFSDCPSKVSSDERKVRQIVLNLISNAVKFTDSGEIKIVATHQELDGQDWLKVIVSDTGCGIPTEHLEKIFEPFHQVDSSTTRQHSGTGLGLAISTNLADAMSGKISVTSEVGSGSTFELMVPVFDVVFEDSKGCERAENQIERLFIIDNPLYEAMLTAYFGDDSDGIRTCKSIEVGIMMAVSRSYASIYVTEDLLSENKLEALKSLSTLQSMASESRIVLGNATELSSDIHDIVDDVISGDFDLNRISAAIGFESNHSSVEDDFSDEKSAA